MSAACGIPPDLQFRNEMKTRCGKIELKPGSLERVREWALEINNRSDEALATLVDEGVVIESVFLDETEHGDFLIYYMRAIDFEQSSAVVRKSTHSIDAFHRQFQKDCWAGRKPLEKLVDLDANAEVLRRADNLQANRKAHERPSPLGILPIFSQGSDFFER